MAETTALAETARAKVNLYLHILGRRDDGYHRLDSLAVFAGAADRLQAEPAADLALEVRGRFAAQLGGDNLVLDAARALRDAAGAPGLGARLVLDKKLPVASGIGGGSADAAAALRLLSRLWRLDLAPADLAGLALRLGADVPVCLAGRPARMGGIGEDLHAGPALPQGGILLVNPGVAVSTQAVFRARTGAFSDPAALPSHWPDIVAMAADLATLRNDLEPPALALCPAIGEALAWLQSLDGCLLARMSGSGATCFGLFADEAAAAAATHSCPPAWWRWGGALA